MPWIEPALPAALEALTSQQRVSVVLAHGFGWTQREIAELLEISTSTVQNHIERAVAKLRVALEVDIHDRP
jgi:RNA polymerase sigma factor (sigma-70 family)